MNQAQGLLESPDHFRADFQVPGARVSVVATTLDALMKTVAQLRPTERVVDAAPTAAPGKPKTAEKSEASAQANKPEAQSSAGPAVEPSAAKTQADASAKTAAGEAFQYDTLKAAVHKLAAVAPDKVVAINKELGVKTMKELPEARWPEAYAKVQAAQALVDAAKV